MGPVHTAGARDRVEALRGRGGRGRRRCSAAGPAARRGRGVGRLLRLARRSSVAPPADAGIVREEQFAPALPVIPYDDIERGGRRGERHRRSGCAPRSGATTTRWPPTWPRGWRPARSSSTPTACRAIDMYAPDGRMEAVGLRRRARARGHAGLRPPARAGARPGPEHSRRSSGMTMAIRGGTVVDGTGAPPRPGRRRDRGGADRRHRPPAPAPPARDTVIDAGGLLVTPGLRRPAHPLRRAALLGPQRQPVPAARRDHGARRQLRLLAGARWRRSTPTTSAG